MFVFIADVRIRLSEEFAQRESEREGLISRRVAEYEKMEKSLKKALQGEYSQVTVKSWNPTLEAKKSEVTVLEQEKELSRIRDDLQKEKDRIRQDVKICGIDAESSRIVKKLKV